MIVIYVFGILHRFGSLKTPTKDRQARRKPLLETVKAHKPEAIYFLKLYWPRCGGCCFAPDFEGRPLCMACDWAALVELYPDLKVKH
jgi:hypothetical protein